MTQLEEAVQILKRHRLEKEHAINEIIGRKQTLEKVHSTYISNLSCAQKGFEHYKMNRDHLDSLIRIIKEL